jgi:hypothetical protein
MGIMAQYQYVVMYDSSTEQWEVDVDTVQDLNDRLFYDSEVQEWIYPDEPDYQVHKEIYLTMEDALAVILKENSMEEM